ncbi:MAG: hypothetical protein JXC85_04190 [Candidatus Aenigmarchaeota archaeon]|nr:hypothetical protein [Candidatus Aenigmarchaeota archaeon]
MLVLKKSIGEGGYSERIVEDLRHAFDGSFSAEPGVIERLGKEWGRWENYGGSGAGRSSRCRFTLSDEGNFWMLRLRKSVFRGEPYHGSLQGVWTREIAVYRDCIAPNGPIYKKMDANR